MTRGALVDKLDRNETMVAKPFGAWMRLGMEAWALGLESSAVIGMRVAKCASGGDPDGKETRLMVTEKLASAMTLQAEMLGLSPLAGSRKAMRHYRGKVAANHKRLLRGR